MARRSCQLKKIILADFDDSSLLLDALFKLIIWSINFTSIANKSLTQTSTFVLRLWIYFFSTQFKYNTTVIRIWPYIVWLGSDLFFFTFAEIFIACKCVENCAHLFNELFRVMQFFVSLFSLVLFLAKPNRVVWKMPNVARIRETKFVQWHQKWSNSVGADTSVHFQ